MLLAKIDSSFDADGPDDDLFTAFGTETLAEGFASTPSSRTDMPVEVISGEPMIPSELSSLRTSMLSQRAYGGVPPL